MNGFCPICEKVTELTRFSKMDELVVRGEAVPIELDLFRCGNCNGEFENPDPSYDPLNQAYEEYRNRKGMLHPSQITAFRKKYNLTQKELSDLLGFGAVTLSRYENGSLQDESHDKLLQFAMDPTNLLHLINEKYQDLNSKKFDSLMASLSNESFFSNCFRWFLSGESSIFTGNKKADINKIVNVIKYFTFGKSVVKSKLLKEMFYADFKHYKTFTTSITGLPYVHAQFGPVPKDFEKLLVAVLDADPKIKSEVLLHGEYPGEDFISDTAADLSCFTQNEISTLGFVENYFALYGGKKISVKSENEKAYKETGEKQTIPYAFALELSI